MKLLEIDENKKRSLQYHYFDMIAKCRSNPKPVLVTPQMAESYLKKNKNIRPMENVIVNEYVNRILNGIFEIACPIAFNTAGFLIDGQHRLQAIVNTGISVPLFIITGLSDSAAMAIDDGVNRKNYVYLKHFGEANSKLLDTSLKYLYKYQNSRDGALGKTNKISRHEISSLLVLNPDIRNSVSLFSSKSIDVCPRSILAFCHYMCSRISKNDADEFFSKLVYGNNLSQKEPILILRNILLTSKSKIHSGISSKFVIASIFKGWNAFRSKKYLSKTSIINGDNNIPTPI